MATLLFGSLIAPKTALLPEVVVHAAAQQIYQHVDDGAVSKDDRTPGTSVARSLNEDELRRRTTRTDAVDSGLVL